jgi:thiol-disulfide isomerase/thioredoxin
MMRETLMKRRMAPRDLTVFSSDGEDQGADLLILHSRRLPHAALFHKSPEARFFASKPQLINTTMQGQKLYPARHSTLRSKMRQIASKLPPQDPRPVMVFVTDHGTRRPGASGDRNHLISLWRESLDVSSYHQLQESFGRRRVVSVMSQCFSGSFAWSVYPRAGQLRPPSGERCGFYATTPDRPAYGCFPDTKLGESVGHAYRFILAMRDAADLDEAHRRVLIEDQTPDVPMRSSDAYLRALLEREARYQGVSPLVFMDTLLQRFRGKTYNGLQEEKALISAIADRFGVTRPLDLTTSLQMRKTLKKQAIWWQRVEENWRGIFLTARNHHLRLWYQKNPHIRAQVKAQLQAIASLRQATPTLAFLLESGSPAQSVCSREALQDRPMLDPTAQAVADRLREGFAKYVASVPMLRSRLYQMFSKEQEMHRYVFWLSVQEAALLRIEYLLSRIAGRLLLEHDPRPSLRPFREGLTRLMACEATPLGTLAQDAHCVKKNPGKPLQSPPLPSWLGIQFRALKPPPQSALPPGAVIVRLVGVGSPAEKAGLREGDIITALNQIPLQEPYEIRERVMLADAQKPIPLTVQRDGQALSLTLKLVQMTTEPTLKLPPVLGRTITRWRDISVFPQSPQQPYTQEALPTLAQGTILLYFWASWCGPCKMPLPKMRLWKQRYAAQGLRVVAVTSETLAEVEPWLRKHPHAMPFAHAADPKGTFSSLFQIRATPTFVLLQQGRVRKIQIGAMKLHEVEASIRKLLASSPTAP